MYFRLAASMRSLYFDKGRSPGRQELLDIGPANPPALTVAMVGSDEAMVACPFICTNTDRVPG